MQIKDLNNVALSGTEIKLRARVTPVAISQGTAARTGGGRRGHGQTAGESGQRQKNVRRPAQRHQLKILGLNFSRLPHEAGLKLPKAPRASRKAGTACVGAHPQRARHRGLEAVCGGMKNACHRVGGQPAGLTEKNWEALGAEWERPPRSWHPSAKFSGFNPFGKNTPERKNHIMDRIVVPVEE
jgi:hypothetical protein